MAILRRCDFLCHLRGEPVLVALQIAKAQARLKTPSLRMELETNSGLAIPHEGFENSLHTAERAPGPRGQGGRSHVTWWLKGVLSRPAPQTWEDLHFSRWARQPRHTCVKAARPKLSGCSQRHGRSPGRDSQPMAWGKLCRCASLGFWGLS